MRRTTTGTSDLIYDSGENSGHWYFGFLASDSKLTFSLNGVADIRSNHVVTDANWHHVAAVKNGSGPGNLLVYLDGVASTPLTVTISAAPTGTKTIGIKNVLFNAPFAGDLDELRLYNRALSAAEVARLAQGRGCVSDGLSWATAFADLQCALDAAASGDEIWVAKSFEPYRPGTSEFARFNLVSGVGVFGNFQGTELNRAQRPPVNFEQVFVTRLSGDLLDDDGGGFTTDNARNVVDAAGTGPGTVFDGLRVEGGFNPDTIGGGGGGLRLHASGQLSVTNALFIRNQAAEAGGGLLASSGQISLDNVIFESNSAETGGGAALLADGAINGGVFRANAADDCGGLFTDLGAVTVIDTRFEFNRAGNKGGGACNSGDLFLDSAVFESNQAGAGGGLYASHAVTLTGSQFLTNTAADAGGALFAEFGPPVAINSGLFAGNTATGTLSVGGAVSTTGPLALGGATFVGNSAAAGGALGAVNGTVKISNTLFLANQAVNGDGGALRQSSGSIRLINLVLVGNQASQRGGAIFVDQSGSSLLQLTAVSNTAAVSGSVLFASSSGVQFANNVVWRNGPGAIGRQSSGVGFSFNLGDAGIGGTGNISADPQFVRAPNPGDGDWTTVADNDYGDLRLTFASPGIDAGNNTLLTLPRPPTDLAGQPRFVDVAGAPDTGVGPAPIVDMGAFEFQFQQLFLPLLRR
ncbi:MAG TPA: LamG domain-containing protein [Chloroflexia bacterium]|nr:LamG domain-containing protein [Chloroflexia bacterium]